MLFIIITLLLEFAQVKQIIKKLKNDDLHEWSGTL